MNASNRPASFFCLSNWRQTTNRLVVAGATSLATGCRCFLLVEEFLNVFVKQFSDVVQIHLPTIFTRSRVRTEPVTQRQCQQCQLGAEIPYTYNNYDSDDDLSMHACMCAFTYMHTHYSCRLWGVVAQW